MKVVERSALVTSTPAEMFALVDDVARYPQFLPGCAATRVEQFSATERLASIEIVSGRFAHGLHHTQYRIAALGHPDGAGGGSLQAPDRPLELRADRRRWLASRFRVEFEFKNRLMALALNSVFESVCDNIVDAFVVRAREVYGAAPQGGG